MSRFADLSRGIGRTVASLAEGVAAPRSQDERVARQIRSGTIDVYRPDKDKFDDYWDLYTSVPIVREPIRAFAAEVMSQGYSVDAPSENATRDLEDWLSSSSILRGEVDRDFGMMVKDVIIQREVRGTAFIEKVPTEDDPDSLWGFKPMPANTVKQYTRPGQAILLAPDESTGGLKEGEDFKRTPDGRVAAYSQFDASLPRFKDHEEKFFARDQVIKLTRDADVGDVWGNSRLAAVEDRIIGIKDKLDANDTAIRSLAWKFWLFKFGTDDEPWDPDDIDSFMSSHKAEDFQPGMKQGVQGDVEIDTIEGEVAEGLEQFLQFDVDWIISMMPMPKYALGGFEENINQFVSRSQETRIENQIREARREIEMEFTPVLKEKAEELEFESDDIELIIGNPEADSPSTSFTRLPAGQEDQDDSPPEGEEEEGIWAVHVDEEQLADPRFVSTREEESKLAEIAEDTIRDSRDAVVSRLETEIPRFLRRATEGQIRFNASDAERVVDSAVNSVLRSHQVTRQSFPVFQENTEKTMEKLSEDLDIDTFASSDRMTSRMFAQEFNEEVVNAVEDMASMAKTQVRVGVHRGESADVVTSRIADTFDDARISNRASLIAHMETLNAKETIKLREYEKDDSVIGIRIINDCDEDTTPLCSQLAGCGEETGATAFFEQGSIGGQLMDHVSEELLFEGFTPLPPTSPFHWACDSETVPIFDDEDEV